MIRIDKTKTELIERTKPISFYWGEKLYQGYEGDTLASALLANGVNLVGRSFKYGRPRGIVAAGVEEPNGLVSLENNGYLTPNIKATEIPLYPGLRAQPARSVKANLRSKIALLGRFIPAGFYYKTFMAPAKLWPWYEKKIRSLAGFATSPSFPDNEHYDHQFHHYDLVVVGAGVAGIAAALEATKYFNSVCLIDERTKAGGELLSFNSSDTKAISWLARSVKSIQKNSRIDMMVNTTAFAWNDHNLINALEKLQDHIEPTQRNSNLARQRLHKIRAGRVLLATGCHERPLLFTNNDLPGVMLLSSVLRYAEEFAVACGSRILIAGNNNSIYQAALDLNKLGLSVEIADIRSQQQILSQTSKSKTLKSCIKKIETIGINIHWQCAVESALGKTSIESARLRQISRIDNDWLAEPNTFELKCDLIACSGGFNPVVHLDCHSGGKPVFDNNKQAFMPACSGDDRQASGSVAGYNSWQACIASATQAVTLLANPKAKLQQIEDDDLATAEFYIADNMTKAFIDLQNDVTTDDIALAIRESYQSIEHIKRYTALGFGTDQGKTSNVNGIAVAAKVLGQGMDEIGTTTFRPAYTPVAFGALAGEHKGSLFEPKRYTAIQQSHINNKAEWELVGQWYRPWYFPKYGESLHQAVDRECKRARSTLAMMDASTLGKIDIQGADAREFLSRIYSNAWAKLAPGSCRYGIMCNENGMIIDDGVTSCLDSNHFLMTTTTGGAAHIYTWLEMWLQTEWPQLKVWLTSVTDHFSTIAVVGPQSRYLLQSICPDVDFAVNKFKFMQWRAGTVCGVEARIMRISFSGELSYEINVQANYGKYIWDQVAQAGKEQGICMYGTESMHVLRAEKGYIIVGQDTDGSVTPADANMSWALANNKPFSYVGKRSMMRSDLCRADRKQLVGLRSKDDKTVLPEGCQLVANKKDTAMIGHVTSSYLSPTLNRPIAMAMVKGGLDKMDKNIYAKPLTGEIIEVIICPSVFYDTKQEKIDGNS